MKLHFSARAFAALSFSLAAPLLAQDTRNVVEPKLPAPCAVLTANLVAKDAKLSETDERKLDTERIQKALDSCKAGMGVELKAAGAKNAFLSGPLELRSNVALVVDRGVTVFASRDASLYEMRGPDAKPGDPVRCGTAIPRPGQFGQEAGMEQAAAIRKGAGCHALITAHNVTNAALMGEGTLDGRGYAKLLGKDYSWWEMARKSEPHDDIYFSSKLVAADHADGLILYKIHLNNAPNYHVVVGSTNGFTAWGVHLLTPTTRGLDARNTDGIDPGNSQNITVAHSWIDNGDDNIAIKSNVQHMSVLDNHFYTGHGMSIGSETIGQAYLLVDGLTEDHTSSGIRIKSNVTRGGQVHDLTYRNICMRNVDRPIAISPYYTNQTTEGFVDPGYQGTKIPDFKKIVLENVYATTPGDVLIAGIDEAHRTQVTLDNVVVTGIDGTRVHLAFSDLTLKGAVGFPLPKVASVKFLVADPPKEPKQDNKPSDVCANKFVPMQ